jgi:hypothetical protein
MKNFPLLKLATPHLGGYLKKIPVYAVYGDIFGNKILTNH